MPRILTKCFAEIEYSETCLYHFPYGLPGYERENAFVFLNRPDSHPLMFMQSAHTQDLCFILLPIFVVDPAYALSLDEEDLEKLQLPLTQQPRIGEDILCAAILCAQGNGTPPTANLLAPVVVNIRDRIGIQAIQSQSGYSHRHPLVVQDAQSRAGRPVLRDSEEVASC